MSIILTGCASQKEYVYVVQRDVPNKPIFTVITTYPSVDSKLVSEVELSLIKLGLSVINPPVRKTVKTQRGELNTKAGQITDNDQGNIKKAAIGNANTGEVTEVYEIFGETNADYAVVVNSKLKIFKVIKKDTREILAIDGSDLFNMNSGKLVSTAESKNALKEYELYDYFKALGFNVRQPVVERPKKWASEETETKEEAPNKESVDLAPWSKH